MRRNRAAGPVRLRWRAGWAALAVALAGVGGALPAAAQEQPLVCDGLKPDGDQVVLGRDGFRRMRVSVTIEAEAGSEPGWALVLGSRDRSRDVVLSFQPVGIKPDEVPRVFAFELYEAKAGDGPVERLTQGGRGVAFGNRMDIDFTNPADGKVRAHIASGFDRSPQDFSAALDIAPMPQETVAVVVCSGARFEFTKVAIE